MSTYTTLTADVAGMIASCRKAQEVWAGLSIRERSGALAAVGHFLSERADELSMIISRENGKTRIEALSTEVLPALMALRYYRKRAVPLLKTRRVRGGNLLMLNKRSRIVSIPYGVVGVISPWNYPFAIPFSEVVMALLAGNAVILKVASGTPAVGRLLASAFRAAALPPGLFAYVEMPGQEAGPAFIEGGVDKLFFTGSTETGRLLMSLAAPRLLPLVLELGGADAAIVRSDADLDRAAAGILWAGFSNAGQSCGGVQRVLVHRSVYQDFLDKLCRRVRSLRVGDGGDWDCDMGGMFSPRQKKAVRDQVTACLEMGACIAAESPAGDLYDEGPTMPALVLTEVTPEMPVMKDEVFGPVVAVLPVSDDEEALRLANDSRYGLTASVWSRDRRKARALAARLHAGAVMINDHLMSHGLAETPWGGYGDSGLGRTHGEAGLREMVRIQVVVDDVLPWTAKNIWWHPYSRRVYEGITAIVEFLYGRTVLRRITAVPRLLGIFLRYWQKDPDSD